MKSNQKNQETSLIDASSFAANSADKLANVSESVFCNSMNLSAQQVAANYAHGRNMANMSSFRPPMEFKNLNITNESELYGDSNSLLTRRLEF